MMGNLNDLKENITENLDNLKDNLKENLNNIREKGQASTSKYIQTNLVDKFGNYIPNFSVLKNTIFNLKTEILKIKDISIVFKLKSFKIPYIGEILIPIIKIRNINEKSLNLEKSKYGKIKVIESKSGHVFIQDDTPGNERILNLHKSGSYEDINSNGDIVKKTVGEMNVFVNKDFIIVVGSDFVNVIKGDYEIQIKGDYNKNILGDKNLYINGNKKEFIRGSSSINSSDDISLISIRNINIKGEELNINIGKEIKINCLGNIKVETTGGIDIKSASPVSILAPIIKLN